MGEAAHSLFPKIRFHYPEKNLPGRKLRIATAEDRLTLRFARAYLDQARYLHHRSPKEVHYSARQIAINGYGIADLVVVSISNKKKKIRPIHLEAQSEFNKPTLRAFEVKMSDWRRGMTQAFRYRYYANVAILVLPANKSAAVLPFLETFRRIHVGLWVFDEKTNRISSYYTPRPSLAKENKYHLKALSIVSQASKGSLGFGKA